MSVRMDGTVGITAIGEFFFGMVEGIFQDGNDGADDVVAAGDFQDKMAGQFDEG